MNLAETTKTAKKIKGSRRPHSVLELSKGSSENILTPVNLTGVLAPWKEGHSGSETSGYKLISSNGFDYLIVANDEWSEVLSKYCWNEVKVIGLLNIFNRTLIPQKVYPKGPTGENVIDLVPWDGEKVVQKIVKKVNDLVLVPPREWAVFAA